MTSYIDPTGAQQPERRKARIEYSRNVPPERLSTAMLDLIAQAGEQGIVVKEMARVFSYSEPAIISRLYAMEEQGEAHRQKHRIKSMLWYTWHLGPVSFAVTAAAPVPPDAEGSEDSESCAVPRQSIVRQYPDHTAHRCALQTAFFGPPKRASDFCVPAEPGTPSPIVDSAPTAPADLALAAGSSLITSRSNAC